ncbi:MULTISPECIES: glycosyl hydrolase family 65 protein [unclassified Paenibacillus]|uniref:glycoside hydrolase family 65 protein n=1 Tax=unclassified Paenibacillus TaxID=185978 RepID=UPI00240586A1|nr:MULTISPECIES: glycosyl hydrolase family 65 protein [unclassified Paenibacillus]MDF9843390.1 alpha,alpha-trehalose phosphorylase [Paenibacillus sp. PastF-2]MDF9849978.1 alpha,alpha-trehalose phosphorylase [Paenibacillus sp. PastM-2]MDF9856686.1 alpha,alpha-trehalose phosphorylase [Paenibacillus sp. PastF-1]MDH6481956.1 alpha,alpha-trehalose phosphorylase [Paenibacillus sp. PastH-2]MDH6509381.1 alpha,alpha-trehalose phosphorylase [Paenibacillus sp. PastM-3]
MSWSISNHGLSAETLLNLESIFALGNGYLGVRGNFEEGYADPEIQSIRGTYLNAFHDVIEIPYGEKLFAFPGTQQKLVNIIDAQGMNIYIGEEEEPFSLSEGSVLAYERTLHMDKGYSERKIHWRSPSGKELKLHFRRLVSFTSKELFAIDLLIEPVNFPGTVKIVSRVNGDVSNYSNPNDPRVAAGHSKRLFIVDSGIQEEYLYVVNETMTSALRTSCVTRHEWTGSWQVKAQAGSAEGTVTATAELTAPLRLTKWNIYTDTLRHEDRLVETGISLQEALKRLSFQDLLAQQQQYLLDFWKTSDVVIENDLQLQEGIRFNLYQLLQSAGRDAHSNISAKGLSGEGYEGHYFWDTEIYMLPVFLMTSPERAKELLLYRYSKLEQARDRAKEMGHAKGALFPWRTISGTECSSFFPSGTAQYHISADVAYSYIQYYLAEEDDAFLLQYGAEVLFETARLWMEIGHYYSGKFHIDEVTGPDEYTCLVNNNYYTNVMAKHNLKWAFRSFTRLQEYDETGLQALCERLGVTLTEAKSWLQAAEAMLLPYDEALGINPQDDTFLRKAVWDFENTPEDKNPLLLHYHPLTLYRYQVCKQADTVLAHFLLEDEQSDETIRRSYDYYEKITTHDSSLSSCIFSIMASKIGYRDKAYNYFIETARLDLDNTHGNTKDGLHLANMGGTWMAIVYGFAGTRLKESGLSLSPSIPDGWDKYAFRLTFRGRLIAVTIRTGGVELELLEGDALTLTLYGQPVELNGNEPVTRPLAP